MRWTIVLVTCRQPERSRYLYRISRGARAYEVLAVEVDLPDGRLAEEGAVGKGEAVPYTGKELAEDRVRELLGDPRGRCIPFRFERRRERGPRSGWRAI